MKNNKVVLIIILFFLAIFLPFTIIGTIFKKTELKNEENINHEFQYKGYLWFYDKDEKFLSKYKCLTDVCGYAKSTIDDTNYDVNYYKDGIVNKIGITDDIYTFIQDGSDIYLYNITNGVKLQAYNLIKNYNTILENNTFIIKNNKNKWGVLTIGSVLGMVLPFEYDYIGILSNHYANGILSTNDFITLKDDTWQILNNDRSAKSSSFKYPIVDYNDKYIFTKQDDGFHVFDFNGKEYLESFNITNYSLVNNYIGVSNGDTIYIYNDLNNKYIGYSNILGIDKNFTLEIQGDNIVILIAGEIVNTIKIT